MPPTGNSQRWLFPQQMAPLPNDWPAQHCWSPPHTLGAPLADTVRQHVWLAAGLTQRAESSLCPQQYAPLPGHLRPPQTAGPGGGGGGAGGAQLVQLAKHCSPSAQVAHHGSWQRGHGVWQRVFASCQVFPHQKSRLGQVGQSRSRCTGPPISRCRPSDGITMRSASEPTTISMLCRSKCTVVAGVAVTRPWVLSSSSPPCRISAHDSAAEARPCVRTPWSEGERRGGELPNF